MSATFVPNLDPYLLPAGPFNALLAKAGVRVAWMRSRSCPCVYAGGGSNGALPFPGGADPACQKCFGVGTYWDAPLLPMMMGMSFAQIEPTSAESGVVTDERWGQILSSEPMLTIPAWNPDVGLTDPRQPTVVWENASISDFFVSVDKQSRYVAALRVGGTTVLPYQQNLQVAATGAVSTYDPVAHTVSYPPYSVDGATVTLPGFPEDTAYMVEFQAAPIYVAYRHAGGVAHVRDFGGNAAGQLPRRFRLQTLDLWTRQTMSQAQAAGSLSVGGEAVALAAITATAMTG